MFPSSDETAGMTQLHTGGVFFASGVFCMEKSFTPLALLC